MKLYRISINASIIFLILTGLIHALSFIAKPVPANDTEKQMMDLMQNYKMDMGAGFMRTFIQIFNSLSACFTLLCLFGGILLYYLNKNNIGKQLMTGVLNIYLVFFGVLFVLMWTLTFLPPILCVTFIFITLILSRWSVSSEKK
jgi:hypothetical protein